MSGEGAGSGRGPDDAGAGAPDEGGNGVEVSDLFRSETAISWLDLRLEVADDIARTVRSEDVVLLEDKDIRVMGSLTNIRGSRDVTVGGDYDRVSDVKDIFAVTGTKITEEVWGNVRLHAERESEAIMGGGFASQNVGPFLRIAGMYDVMCWGGWTEADVARTEVADAVIKAYFTYTHAVGFRTAAAYQYFDDFVSRTEIFSTLNDNTTLAEELGGPGSGEIVEM